VTAQSIWSGLVVAHGCTAGLLKAVLVNVQTVGSLKVKAGKLSCQMPSGAFQIVKGKLHHGGEVQKRLSRRIYVMLSYTSSDSIMCVCHIRHQL
jgi:hypothetical protein